MFKIRRFFTGYMYCQMDGGKCQRLINVCRKNQIYMWHIAYGDSISEDKCDSQISKEKNAVTFFVLAHDYELVHKYARQCGGSLRILEKYGLPFFIQKNRKRVGVLAGICAGCMLVYIMSLFIWNIEIYGNSHYSETVLIEFLQEMNAGCGVKKNTIVPSKLEEDIRISFPYVSWVSVRIVGTKLLIEMEEGTIVEAEQEESDGDLCAMEKGVVLSIMTRSGTPLVHAGDEVEKGEILISDSVDIIGDDLSVVDTIETGADGDVFLQIDYPVERKFLKIYNLKQYTQNEMTKYAVNIAEKNMDLSFGKAVAFENYDLMIYKKHFRFTENFYIPLQIEKYVYKEYVLKKAVYTDEEMEQQMSLYLNTVIENISAMEGEVLENHTVMEIKGNYGYISGFLTAKIKNSR